VQQRTRSSRSAAAATMRLGYCLVHQKLKKFQDLSSHRILLHKHGALNIDKIEN